MDQFEDQMLASSLQAFAAAAAGHVTLPPVKLHKVLLALDGSDQDVATRSLAERVAARTGAEVLERGDLRSAQDVLQAVDEGEVDLIVMDAPFRDDFTVGRHESLGISVDLVLSRSRTPVLVAREPLSDVLSCFSDVLIQIYVSCAKTATEVAWALALATPGGKLQLLDVTDVSVIEEAKVLLGDAIDVSALREEALKRAATRDAGPVVAAAREAASKAGVQVDFEVRVGRPGEVFDEVTRDRTRLVVTSLPGIAGTPEYHRARHTAMRSRGPVLFV